MLAQRFDDFPLTIEAGMEGHQVTGDDADRFTAGRGDEDFAFQDVGGFGFVKVDREPGDFLFPDLPVGHAEFFQAVFAGIVFDGDFAHEVTFPRSVVVSERDFPNGVLVRALAVRRDTDGRR